MSADSTFRLRLLATSDLHVHLSAWDYYTDRSSAMVGLARTASLIQDARAEAAALGATCLLVDNGDFLNGSPLGDLEAHLDGTPGRIHPMIAAMNALRYDVATLGNHEFSEGLDFLMRRIRAADFPIISANIAWVLGPGPLQDQTLVPPTVLLQRELTDAQGRVVPIVLGIIGLLPPQTTQWDRQHLGNRLMTRDIVQAAAAHVPDLRRNGADLVIALSHSGIGQSTAQPNMENATAALAALPGIDALVAGHTHQLFPSPGFRAVAGSDPVRGYLWGKPAVMPGFHGSHLGVIDLVLTRSGGAWQVVASQVELRAIARRTKGGRVVPLVRNAPQISAIAAPAQRATRNWVGKVVGHSAVTLHSYFALVMPCPTVRLVARAQAEYVARLLRDGPYRDMPLVSAVAPVHAGGRGGPENYTVIPAGPILMRHVFDLYPHPNTVSALRVTGAELLLWLERSFSLFHQIVPGSNDAALIDMEFPAFNFDVLEGLTWEVDLSQPPRYEPRGAVLNPQGLRIRNLAYQGQPVDPEVEFVLATNSYRAAGSGGFPGTTPDRQILSGPAFSRDVVLAHIAGGQELAVPSAPNWRFVAMPGTTVTFVSAPEAAAHLAELQPLKAEALDIGAHGFRRFRLHL